MTDRLLPPIRAEELVPGRLASQGQRVRRGELKALQTPRTYRMSDPTYRTMTTGYTTLGVLPVFLQPAEILGFMCTVDIRATAAAGFAVYVSNTSNPWNTSLDVIVANAPTTAQRITFASQPTGVGGGVNWPLAGQFPGAFTFLMDFRDPSGGTRRGPATPQEIAPEFRIQRTSGSGTLQISDFQAWAMVL